MRLSARCPACTTLFKVVPDQLKISDGWVRCGQCGEVFDAHASAAMSAADVQVPDGGPSLLPGTVASDASGSPASSPLTGTDTAPLPSAPLEMADIPLLGASPDEGPSIGFLAGANPVRAKRARRGMGLAALLLTLVLVVQVALFQRDRLAASAPAWQPALATLCFFARCTLAPVRQIESVALDSSTFTQLRPDTFKLSFVLKNEAPIALAMPALEVTLTDNQDRAVVRRVVLPADFAPPGQPLAAGGEFAGSLVLGLAADTAEPRSSGISGYRVLAFYP